MPQLAKGPAGFSAAELKIHFKDCCTNVRPEHQNWQIRVHRAISWLKRAEESPPDEAKFLFLLISLNCLYARWNGAANAPDRDVQSRKDFFYEICNPQGRRPS